MGFTPQDVDELSLFQFAACAQGYKRANSPAENLPAPSADEFDAMVENHLRVTGAI